MRGQVHRSRLNSRAPLLLGVLRRRRLVETEGGEGPCSSSQSKLTPTTRCTSSRPRRSRTRFPRASGRSSATAGASSPTPKPPWSTVSRKPTRSAPMPLIRTSQADSFSRIDPQQQEWLYCGLDAAVTLELDEVFQARIEKDPFADISLSEAVEALRRLGITGSKEIQ